MKRACEKSLKDCQVTVDALKAELETTRNNSGSLAQQSKVSELGGLIHDKIPKGRGPGRLSLKNLVCRAPLQED